MTTTPPPTSLWAHPAVRQSLSFKRNRSRCACVRSPSRPLPLLWPDGIAILCQDEQKHQLRAVVWPVACSPLATSTGQPVTDRAANYFSSAVRARFPWGPPASICRAGIQTPISRIGSPTGLLPAPVEAERSSPSAISLEIPRRTLFLIAGSVASNRYVWHVHAVLAKSLTASDAHNHVRTSEGLSMNRASLLIGKASRTLPIVWGENPELAGSRTPHGTLTAKSEIRRNPSSHPATSADASSIK